MSDLKISSSPEYLTSQISKYKSVVWRKGSHYAYVYEGWGDTNPVDAFSFGWEHNKASMLDFTSALQTWMNDNV